MRPLAKAAAMMPPAAFRWVIRLAVKSKASREHLFKYYCEHAMGLLPCFILFTCTNSVYHLCCQIHPPLHHLATCC